MQLILQVQQRLQTALSDVASMRQQMRAARGEAAHQSGLLTQAQLKNAQLCAELRNLQQRMAQQQPEELLQSMPSEDMASIDWASFIYLDSPEAQAQEGACTGTTLSLAAVNSPQPPCTGCEALRAAHASHLSQLGAAQQQLMASLEVHVMQLMAQHETQRQHLAQALCEAEARTAEHRAQMEAVQAELGVLRAQEAVEREARLRGLGCANSPANPQTMASRNAFGAQAQSPPVAADGASHPAPAPTLSTCWLEPELGALQASGNLVGRGGYAEVYAVPAPPHLPDTFQAPPPLVVKVSEPIQAPMVPAAAHAHTASCPDAAEQQQQQDVAKEAAVQLATALADLVPVFLPRARVPHLARPLHWYWRAEPQQPQQPSQDAAAAATSASMERRASEAASSNPPGFVALPTTAPPAQPPHVRLYTVWERYDQDLEQYLGRAGGCAQGAPCAHLTRREAAAVACSVAEALAGLHAVGAVHCDVRPANILLHTNSATPGASSGPRTRIVRADLADCGLLTWMAPGSSCSPMYHPGGSWLYRAPEQQQCPNMAGPCCDVWQLGLLLSSLLTGAPAPPAHQGTPHLLGPDVCADVAVAMPEGLNDRATYILRSELVPPAGGQLGCAGCGRCGPEGGDAEDGEQAARIQDLMCRIAQACLASDPAARPSAAEVASALQWVLDA